VFNYIPKVVIIGKVGGTIILLAFPFYFKGGTMIIDTLLEDIPNGQYRATCLIAFCVDQECHFEGKVCEGFKTSKCDILNQKKEEFKERLIKMYEHNIVDITLLKYVMYEICVSCDMQHDCDDYIKPGSFKCIAASESITGMKAEGKLFKEEKLMIKEFKIYDKAMNECETTGCNGFKHCTDREFDANKEDCQECAKDAYEAIAYSVKYE
jgi:hypothetical protein